MNRPQSLDAALKSAQTILKQYVRALVSENLKLQKQVAQLYAKNVSKDHLIASLKGELQKLGHKDPSTPLPDFEDQTVEASKIVRQESVDAES